MFITIGRESRLCKQTVADERFMNSDFKQLLKLSENKKVLGESSRTFPK